MTLTPEELFDGAPVALLAVNLNGEVLTHNEGLTAWLGYEGDLAEQVMRGRNLVEWLSPASRLLYETRIMPILLEAGSVREAILEARDRQGRLRSVLFNARLRTIASGERVVFIAVVDAADRIAFEQQLVEARRSAEVAHQRLAVLQEATSRIALAQGTADLGDVLVAAAAQATQAGWTAVRIEAAGDAPEEDRITGWGSAPGGGSGLELPTGAAEQVVCRGPEEIRRRFPDRAAALAAEGVEALVVTPIVRGSGEGARVLGAIQCWFRRTRTLDEETLETLRALAAQAELVIDHLNLQERLRHRALHDALTGLPNRLLFEERLAQLLAASERAGEPCAVLFLDLDGFKAINDRLGHAVGDDVLRIVAGRLRATCRAGETVSRLGGDEFVIAAAGAGEAGATELAHRVWAAIRTPLDGPAEGSPLSSSIGVMCWDPAAAGPAPTAAQLVSAADASMYEVKHGGKDAVSVRAWSV